MDEQSIFTEALEKQDPVQRAAFLDQACVGNLDFRRRIERLLEQHQDAGSFLEPPSPALGGTLNQPVAERPGTVIGPYKLLQQIGEGGMGTVYMAEQSHPVQRKVALKVIKAGMDSGQVIARFEAERQALALMDHPNIAKVLDAGTTAAGRPYFVMELVKGVPITQYCDENHLPPKARLELFTQVCQAVQHAHQKGIIHRDIKPTNVLVTLYDDKPVPKVIDFGVAKATGGRLTERTMFTGYGQIVGTIEYMSPEQARLNALDVDTRGDIYSLGVLLYELLTGTTPFDKQRLREAAFDEMLRMIREDEPPKPSTRLSELSSHHAPRHEPSGHVTRSVTATLASIAANRSMEPNKLSGLVRGELDWIVMKALEKDRSRRYETANGFAADVLRYLNDEAVQACPPSRAYQVKKFLRRNKGAALTMSLVFAALVVGVIATSWQARRAWVAEKNALGERDAKDHALESERRARAEATLAGEQTLAALRAMTDAAIARHIGRQVQLSERDREFFNQVLILYERFAAVQGDSRESRALRGEGYYRIAYIRYGMRDLQSALSACTQARGQLKQLVADFPAEPDHRIWLAKCHGLLIEILGTQGRLAEAEAEAHLAIALGEQLEVDFPSVPEYREQLGANHGRLGSVLGGLGKWAASGDAYRRAAQVYEQLAELHPATPHYRHQLVLERVNVGLALSTVGDHAGAELEMRRALSVARKLTADHPDVAEYRDRLASCHRNLGGLLRTTGKLVDAEPELRQSLALEKTLVAEFPGVPKNREALAKSHTALATLLLDLDRAADAESELREALDLQNDLVRDFPSVSAYPVQLAMTNSRLGLALEKQHRLEEAIAAHQRAVELDPGWVYSGLIRALTRAGRLDQTVAEHDERLRRDPQDVGSHHFVGQAHFQQRHWKEAAHHFSRVLELNPSYGRQLPPARLQAVRGSLASAYVELRQWEEAIAQYNHLVEEGPQIAAAHNDLAWLLATCPDAKVRDPARAVELAKRAVELAPQTERYRNTLGVGHYRAGDWQAAIAALDKSMQLRKGGDSFDWFFLAMAHWQVGNKDEARKWYDQAVEWMKKNQPQNEELRRLSAEAAELLELEKETN